MFLKRGAKLSKLAGSHEHLLSMAFRGLVAAVGREVSGFISLLLLHCDVSLLSSFLPVLGSDGFAWVERLSCPGCF